MHSPDDGAYAPDISIPPTSAFTSPTYFPSFSVDHPFFAIATLDHDWSFDCHGSCNYVHVLSCFANLTHVVGLSISVQNCYNTFVSGVYKYYVEDSVVYSLYLHKWVAVHLDTVH